MRRKLTNDLVKNAKSKAAPYEIRDTDIKGLLVRIQPKRSDGTDGVKSFVVEWGRAKRVTLDQHYPVLTIEAARTRALEILRDAKDGVPSAARRKSKALTFDGFLTDHYGPWVTAERKSGKATLANLRAQFGKDFGAKSLSDVTAWNIEKFKSKRLKAGIDPVTVNRDLDRIRAAINKAVEWKLLPNNPLSSVKRIRLVKDDLGEKDEAPYLKPDEEARLRAALIARETHRRAQRASGNTWARERGHKERPLWAADEFTDHLMPMVLLAINTGLRRGELFGLKWERVNFERKQLTVAASTAKSGKVRYVPLNAEAIEVLERWTKQHDETGGLVFPGAGGSTFTHINRSWAGVVKDAELKGFRFHDLRHHFASRLVMSGADLYTVKELLGHSDFEMTQRYAHLSAEHKAAAVEKLVAAK